MSNLADQVIEANEQEYIEKTAGDQAPEGYYTDDLGLWVEQDIRKNKQRFAQYVLVRCKKLNPHLHTRDNAFLFNSHTIVNKHPNDIAELAGLAETLTTPLAALVYNRLIEIVPKLDKTRIEVTPGLVWNMDTCEFEEWETNKYTTVS